MGEIDPARPVTDAPTLDVPAALNAEPLQSGDATPEAAGLSTQSFGAPGGARPAAPGAPPQVAGYEVLGELGRGGMGVVYQARQVQLKRLVALKMILAGTHAGSAAHARFLAEAEAVARLQHPNIVQIHEIGAHGDLPYFSLEFVDGGSLASRLDGTPWPDAPAATIVETLARAMHVAHTRHIVHRDLKPANVLLTSDGVPKITDFGLAKQLDSDAGQTRSGAIMGTPSYMAPEQAEGAKEIGPAADVYALGAILYELLTGRPPFRADTPMNTVLLVMLHEPVPPCRLQPRVARDLETICLKCLHKDPARRYASALALAEDLRRFLNAEPILARPVGRVERCWRWCRRKPALAAVIALASLLIVGGASGTLWYVQERAERETERRGELQRKRDLAEQTIREALRSARKAREELYQLMRRPGGALALLNDPARWHAPLQRAQLALERGKTFPDDIVQLIDPDLRRQVSELDGALTADDADRELALRLEKIRLDAATLVDNHLDHASAEREFPKTLAGAGLRVLDEPAEAVAARVADSPIKDVLVAALDQWAAAALTTKNLPVVDRLLEVSRRAAPDPWGDRLRQPEVWRERTAVARLAQQAKQETLSPQFLELVGRLLGQGTPEHLAWLRQAQALHPADFWLNFDLGFVLMGPSPLEAAGLFRAALALRPDNVAASLNLSYTLADLKRPGDGVAVCRRAVELDPTNPRTHYTLGDMFAAAGRLAEAEAAYGQALAQNPDFAEVHTSIGKVYLEQRRFAEAAAACRRSLAAGAKFNVTYDVLGRALRQLNQLDEAAAAFEEVARLSPKYADCWHELGNIHEIQGRLDQASAAYRKAIAANPKLIHAYGHLAVVLHSQKRLAEAVDVLRKAVEVYPAGFRTHARLGSILFELQRYPEAIAAYQKALALEPKFTEVHFRLGVALMKMERWPEAVASLRRSVELEAQQPLAQGVLGDALLHQCDFAAAEAATQTALDLLPAKHPQRDMFEEQLKECRRQHALARRLPAVLEGKEQAAPAALLELAGVCMTTKRNGAAVSLYERAFAAQPNLATDPHRYHAASAATLAALDDGEVAAAERARLHRQARDWLQAELVVIGANVKMGDVRRVLQMEERLEEWQRDVALAGVRERRLETLPGTERAAWRKLWADVQQTLDDVGDRFATTYLADKLTAQETTRTHPVTLRVGRTYVADLESTAFDALVRLEDATGKHLAESAARWPGQRNACLILTAPASGTFRLSATSANPGAAGSYTLRLREFPAND
jgi:serine/threonine-protein kinase